VRCDDFLKEITPAAAKIDVEGYEIFVLKGAAHMLKSKDCQVVILELRGHGRRYGVHDMETDALMRDFGFDPCTYQPFSREIQRIGLVAPDKIDVIYIKEIERAQETVRSAPAFNIGTYPYLSI
jgi:hypothetical protein